MDESTTQRRAQHMDAKARERQLKINRAKVLEAKGYSKRAIANEMNMPESSVRALLQTNQSD